MLTRPSGAVRVDGGGSRRRAAGPVPAPPPASHTEAPFRRPVPFPRPAGPVRAAVVGLLTAGCAAAPVAGALPATTAPPTSAAPAATSPPAASPSTSPAAERMSTAMPPPWPSGRPADAAARVAGSVAVVRRYLTAAVTALRGGDPGPLAEVAGPGCACRSVLADAARFRTRGGVAGFDVLLAGAAEVDALGDDVSVIAVDYTVPAHVEPAGSGVAARPVAGVRVRAEVSVRWTGPRPVVDRFRVVRRWPA